MSCCGGGSRFNGTSNLSGSTAVTSSVVAAPDGPWTVIRPVRGSVNGKEGVTVRHEQITVATYTEAEALIREIDPTTKFPFGGGIRRAPAGTPLTSGAAVSA